MFSIKSEYKCVKYDVSMFNVDFIQLTISGLYVSGDKPPCTQNIVSSTIAARIENGEMFLNICISFSLIIKTIFATIFNFSFSALYLREDNWTHQRIFSINVCYTFSYIHHRNHILWNTKYYPIYTYATDNFTLK